MALKIFSTKRRKLIPRKRKCLLIFLLVSVVQMIFYMFYDSHPQLEQFNNVTNVLDLSSHTASSVDFIGNIERKLANLDLSKDYSRYWKFFTQLNNYKLAFDPSFYSQQRSKKHFFDPRVTYSVYLNYIKNQYESINPLNNDESEAKLIKIPFSWQDWVDLSVLNPYLEYPEAQKPSCKDLLLKGLDYSPETQAKKQVGYEDSCIDNSEYTGLVPKELLPGFNFIDRANKRSFLEKKIHAKSYLLSGAPVPNSILFLSENGTYEVYPEADQNMLTDGLFDSFLNAHDDATPLVVDPLKEFDELMASVPGRKPELDFDQVFTAENNYKYNIPIESFTYKYKDIIADYESRRESLTDKERRHFESLKYSESKTVTELTKSFREVNIKWPVTHNGHKLTEGGAHYDFRFFNGLLTESQINQYDDVNEKRKTILHRMLHTWLQFTYKEGIVALVAHGSLLSWYWDGLVFEWDNDIDVQMPIMDLDKFARRFNNSMVVEDIHYGFNKYYIDCGSFMTHRTNGNGKNNIDARFIDVDNGLYIDITGLAVTGNVWLPKRFQKLYKKDDHKAASDDADAAKMALLLEEGETEGFPIRRRRPYGKGRNLDIADAKKFLNAPIADKDEDEDINDPFALISQIKPKGHSFGRIKSPKRLDLPTEEAYTRNKKLNIVNCRNSHFYTYDELSPISLSMMEGVPSLIPNDFEEVLKSEYATGLSKHFFNKHLYINELRFWLPLQEVQKTIRKIEQGAPMAYTKLLKFYHEHEVAVLQNLFQDDEILKEFCLTYKTTGDHKKELALIKDIKLKKGDAKQKTAQYHELLESYKHLKKPLRKDLFNYLNEIDQLAHSRTLHLENDQDTISEGGVFYHSEALHSVQVN